MPEGGLQVGRWVIGASAVLGGALLAGRLSGLLREIELAATFGVSASADAAVLLLTLPDLLVNLLLSGGLSAALVPRLRALAPADATVLLRQIFAAVLAIFGLFATLFAVLPAAWFALLAPGMPTDMLPPAIAVVATALAVPLTAASGVTTAGLNAAQRFLVAGCGTLFFNLAVVAALWAARLGLVTQMVALGLGIAAGAVLRLVTQMVSLPRGWLFGPIWRDPPDRVFLRGFVAAALAASMMLLVPVLVRAFASEVKPGAIAALNYAFKLVELPAGVLVTSLATVALARLSEHLGRGEAVAARRVLHDSVQRAMVNAVGAGLVVAYFADAIVAVVFGRGAMGASEIERVAGLTRITLIGLPFLALAAMAIADLNARQRPQVVLGATLGCLLLLPLFAWPGVHERSESLLALAVVGFQVVHALCLARVSGLLGRGGGAWLDARMCVSLALGVLVVAVAALLDRWLGPGNSGGRLILAGMATLVVIVLPHRALAWKKRAIETP